MTRGVHDNWCIFAEGDAALQRDPSTYLCEIFELLSLSLVPSETEKEMPDQRIQFKLVKKPI